MFNLPFFSKKKDPGFKPVVLLILDGWGIAPHSNGNAITLAKTPNYDSFLKDYPNGHLIASGESVGLPANEVGNTEIGHLTMGSGRVIFQDLKRINVSIERGTFYDNKAFLRASAHVKAHNSKLHILGLVGTGNVHSSIGHLFALIQFANKENIDKIYLHLFTDGRDSPPKEGIEMINKIEAHLNLVRVGKIASISGRYYAMDRDRRWDRTEKAYKAIVEGLAIQTKSAKDAIYSAYSRGQTDEFIEPTIIADQKGPIGTVEDNDAVIMINFRIDRPKQLTMAFVLKDFESLKSYDFGYNTETSREEGEVQFGATFKRGKVPNNLFFVTMTEYHKNLPVAAVAFGPEQITSPLAEIISRAGLQQMHMAESEKERFVTYYFDGLRDQFFQGEEACIVASPSVPTYDLKPEMSLPKLFSEFKKNLEKGVYKFFVINYANADMVGHTGNLKATIASVEIVDKYLKLTADAVMDQGGCLIITGDHGNAEELIAFPTTTYFFTTEQGSVNTDHSNNPVPLIVVRKDLLQKGISLLRGTLSDIAPTILGLMDLKSPSEMTGVNLVEGLIAAPKET